MKTSNRLEPEQRRMDANDLRKRAKRWREIAVGQKSGAGDAMIEAACELEVKASRLERERERQGRRPPKR
jgi:hypothetical protein